MLQVRQFNADDYEEVSQWWKGHGREPMPLDWLPALGVVIFNERHEQAAMWLYMDNSVGVCFCEKAVTRPGLTALETREALSVGLDFLRREAAALGYGVMLLRVYPAIAKFAQRLGFEADDRHVVCLSGATEGRKHA